MPSKPNDESLLLMVLQIHAAPRLEFSLLQPIFAKRFQDVKKVSSIDLRHGEGLFPNLYLKSSVRCSRARSPVTRRVPCILSNHNECSPSAPPPPPTSLAIALMRQWRLQRAAPPPRRPPQSAKLRWGGAALDGQVNAKLPSAPLPLLLLYVSSILPTGRHRRRAAAAASASPAAIPFQMVFSLSIRSCSRRRRLIVLLLRG